MHPSSRLALGAVALATVMLAASPAQARFGKRTPESSEEREERKVHDAGAADGSQDGEVREREHQEEHRRYERRGRHHEGTRHHHPRYRYWDDDYYYQDYHYGWHFGYAPIFFAAEPVPVGQVPPLDDPPPTLFLGVNAQAHGQEGFAGSLEFGGEGFGIDRGFGGRLNLTGIEAPSDDYTATIDVIRLVDFRISYAFLSGRHGRLRGEIGINWAEGPDAGFMAPDVGLSGSFGLIGPLGLEGSIAYARFRHQRVDATAGIGIAAGAWGFHAGWRHLWLDDRGEVDGVRHTDTFSGPSLGVSLSFP